MPKAIGIIPARFSSTRFPGKSLSLLKGKPLIQHVYERVRKAHLIQNVVVATDNKEIYDAVERFGGEAVMTSEQHQSGTDRIAEAVLKLHGTEDMEIIVNVQGDEPLITPEMVNDVVKLLSDDPRAEISTLVKKTTDAKEILSPDVVKAVLDNEGFAMYFSRAPIPFYRDEWQLQRIEDKKIGRYEDKKSQPLNFSTSQLLTFTLNSELRTFCCYKHIGIYAYRKDALLRFSKLPPARLEKIEKLEQLRALENGFKIKVKETASETIGVDTPEDLERVEKWLNSSL